MNYKIQHLGLGVQTHPLPPDLLGCCSVKANIINGSDLLMQGADGCRYEYSYRPGCHAFTGPPGVAEGVIELPPCGLWGNLFT